MDFSKAEVIQFLMDERDRLDKQRLNAETKAKGLEERIEAIEKVLKALRE